MSTQEVASNQIEGTGLVNPAFGSASQSKQFMAPGVTDAGNSFSLRSLGLVPEDDVARMLGITDVTIATWRRERRGPSFVQLGRGFYYREKDLQAWVDDNVTHIVAAKSKAS